MGDYDHGLAEAIALVEDVLAARAFFNDRDSVSIQRDDLRERLDRIRAAVKSDPALKALSEALRGFLLQETRPGWLNVTDEMVVRLRVSGSYKEPTP